jgi:hypothetical protein
MAVTISIFDDHFTKSGRGAADAPSGIAATEIIDGTMPFMMRHHACFEPFRPDRTGGSRLRGV